MLWWLACFSTLVSRKHYISDSRISQRGIKIKPTVNPMVPTVDEVRTTQDLFTKYGSCTGVGSWMDDVGCADRIGGPDGYDRDYARRTTTFRLPLSTSPLRPLHPFFATEHDFVWCLPPGPLWWEQALKEIRWTPVSYTHLTLPTTYACRSRWSPYH